jgi:hypothetical protein
MKTVIVVSPHFPPSMVAGVHRARHLAKHLPSHGWQPIVVRVDERHYTEVLDPALAALVPENVSQMRTGAIPAPLARLAGVGNIGLRAFFPIKQAIEKLVSTVRPDAILITGEPFYPMLLSEWIKRRFRVPVVLDFQDPWVSAEGATRPRWSKGGLAHRLAEALEPLAVRHADFVTSVSDRQNDEMAVRYPWLDRGRMAAIPIGGDPEDFDALRASPPLNAQVRLDPTRINLSYVGTFLPRAGPLMRTLFRALRAVRLEHPTLAAKLTVHFLGTSNQPNGHGLFRIAPLAREEGVGDLVVETPQRVPYLEALHILSNSHGLLLIGSDEPHYTASKIYPALMSARPYISLFNVASSAHAILNKAGGGLTFGFDAPEQLSAIEAPLSDALVELAGEHEHFGRADPKSYASYSAHAVAGNFARIFDGLL